MTTSPPAGDRLPEGLSQDRDLEMRGRAGPLWARRALLGVLVAFVALGLAGVFGQESTLTTATGAVAEVRLDAPARLRGGLMSQGRIQITAVSRIAQPRIVLGPGWNEGITINTVTPSPAAETTDDEGRWVLAYDELPAGGTLTVRLETQVNPTTTGRRDQGVEVRDGATPLARVARTVTIFP